MFNIPKSTTFANLYVPKNRINMGKGYGTQGMKHLENIYKVMDNWGFIED